MSDASAAAVDSVELSLSISIKGGVKRMGNAVVPQIVPGSRLFGAASPSGAARATMAG